MQSTEANVKSLVRSIQECIFTIYENDNMKSVTGRDKMQNNVKMLAFDFGASSGRAMLANFDGEKLSLEEMHRFSNDPVNVRGSLYWDVLRLFYEIKQGILKCANGGHKDIASIGIDTWGVDFGLLDGQGNLLGNPYHYRDTRTEGMMEEAFKLVPKEEIYGETGIQIIWFNTIYQLLSMKINNSPMLEKAKTLLLMPDLFNYFLTGVKSTEFTNATTTQLFNPTKGTWAKELMRCLGIPAEIFTDIVHAGTIIGSLSPDISKELGVGDIPVVSVASHDTGSAVAAVPVIDEEDYIYISCGTWSLMGVEANKPIINEKSFGLNFTNEGGVNNTIRFLKNIMGLWLVQECKRQWDREGEKLSFAELEQMAWNAKPFVSFVDPDHHSFATPGNMPQRIRDFCKNTNQPVPESKGEIIRCVAQSLALKYRYTVECLEEILGKKLNVIHMIGGGIKDKMLCQLTANATGREVVAGPVEATSIGNIIVQAMALKEIGNLREARQIVKNSFPTTVYQPENISEWDEAYSKFVKLISAEK
jgi:rhamnulokinase